MVEPLDIELRGISKRFGRVLANDAVDLRIRSGEMLGLLGENGAGKSTLMKILTGFQRADRGRIIVNGQEVAMSSPAVATALGIGMLHQEPLDFPALTVLDDFLVGAPQGLRLDRGRARAEFESLAKRYTFRISPDAWVDSLSLGERQQLEILRLLWRGARLLILDEPTTAISALQHVQLFATLHRLASEGMAVIFVSHKLEEVLELCDRVVVLARGRVTGEAALPQPKGELVRMMFGRELAATPAPPAPGAAVRGGCEDLAVSDGRVAVHGLSLSLREGEIIGVAGLEGNGQRPFMQAFAGLRRPERGRLRIGGDDLTGKSYAAFRAAGVAYIPADRMNEGLVNGLTVAEHAILADARAGFRIDVDRARALAEEGIRAFRIRGEPDTRAEELSGGNQQRLLLSLLSASARLLILEHPTRGLDIEAEQHVWEHLAERAAAGASIIFSSADLDELLAGSHRVLVFCGGRTALVERDGLSSSRLGEMIAGEGVA